MIDIAGLVANARPSNGIWFCDERLISSYPEDGNETYFQIEEKSFWFTHRNQCILASVKRYGRKSGVFVEIGSGNGYVSKALQDLGFEMLLIEPDLSGILNAKKRGLENLLCSSFETTSFAENSVSCAGLFDVLEHIREQEPFLNKVYSMLEINGLLYTTVPAFGFLWSAEDIHDGHVRRYTRKSLRELLCKAGFTIVYSTCFFELLPLPIFLFRRIPSMAGFPRKQTAETYAKENAIANQFLSKVAHLAFDREIKKISKGGVGRFGSSILVVAKK